MAKVCLIEYVDGTSSPWSLGDATWHMPPDDFTLAVGPIGQQVRFADDVWHLWDRDVAANQRGAITIPYKGEPGDHLARSNISQCKSILLALDKHAHRSPGQPLGVASMNRYNLALQHVRRYCRKSGQAVFDVLSKSGSLVGAFKLYHSKAPATSSALPDLVLKLSSLPIRYVGFAPALIPSKLVKGGTAEIREFHQTEIIPTKIYLDLIVSYKGIVNEYLDVKENLHSLVSKLSASPSYGRASVQVDGDTSDFDDAIAAEGLHEYACRYSVSNLVELQRHFGLVYYACIMLFYAFTGMRRSEAYSLNLKSLKRKVQGGRVIAYGLAGFTTKFRKSRMRVVWYTSQDVVAPFEAASHICETIMDCNGCRTEHQYLFLTTTYFPFAIGRKGRALGSSAPTLGNYEPYKYQRFIGEPIIDSSHIRELQTFNPFRQWESEDKFLVGKSWPLKIHQFRRSTAVYAMASGLVSLPALKSMLKHLTVAMSRYYAKGSIYAHNILKRSEGDKDAWVVRYQESEVFVRAFQYVNELIVPDEVLYGPAGVWLERNAKPGLKKISYADSLENTLIKMQKGQLSYRSTPVGGCTFNGECDKRISVDFVGCDGCSYSAVKLSKVSKLIATQEVFVSNIIGQAEQQFEKNTLDELKDFARRMGGRDVDIRVN